MTELPNRNLNLPGRPRLGVGGRKRRYGYVEYGPTEIDTTMGETYSNVFLAKEGHQRPFPHTQTDIWRRQVGRFKNQPTTFLYHPSRNGWNDPLTIMVIVDCLLRLNPRRYVSAAQLTAILQDHYKMISWDQHTVGKVLSDLHSWAQMAERPKGRMAPIERVTWNGSRQYVLDHSLAGWDWLGQAREYLGQAATKLIAIEHHNQIILPRSDEVWDGLADCKWNKALAS